MTSAHGGADLTLIVVASSGPQNHRQFLRNLAHQPARTSIQVIWLAPRDEISLPLTGIEIAPGDRITALEDAIDLATGRFVAMVDLDFDKTKIPAFEKLIRAHTQAAHSANLDSAELSLPLLTGHRDAEFRSAWIAWAGSRSSVTKSQEWRTYRDDLPFVGATGFLDAIELVTIDNVQALALRGRLIQGISDGDSPPSHDIEINLKDAHGRVVHSCSALWEERFSRKNLGWFGFKAAIALADLPDGPLTVEALVGSRWSTSETHFDLRMSNGARGSTRKLIAVDRCFHAEPSIDGSRTVLHTGRNTRWGRLTWTPRALMRDVASLRKPHRFWWVRWAQVLTRPFMGRRPVWLIGEREDTAQDNGYHLFKYLCDNPPQARVRYIIDSAAPQIEKVRSLGKIVRHSSLRHRFLMLHADVLINAYTIKHITPRQWHPHSYRQHFAWRIGSKRVYLKHGINLNSRALDRGVNGFEIYVTGAHAETIACSQASGYDHQVIEAGLPRFDALIPTPPSRTIVFMPTWRSYLAASRFQTSANQRAFVGSTYHRFVEGLLTDPRLHALLRQYDFRLELLPHYNMRSVINSDTITDERVHVLSFDEVDVQQKLLQADLFMTDYSSVQFDIAYLGTPLIYTQFDEQEFQSGHGDYTWFDTATDGFGPIARTVDETIVLIAHYLSEECQRETIYSERAQATFAHQDQSNSARVTQAISALNDPRIITSDDLAAPLVMPTRSKPNRPLARLRGSLLVRQALHYRERKFADRLALQASNGQLNYTELIQQLRLERAGQAPFLRLKPREMGRCAHVMLAWAETDEDLDLATQVLEELVSFGGAAVIPAETLDTAAKALHRAGSFLARDHILADPRVSDDVLWAVATDDLRLNGAEADWLTSLSKPFMDSGLAPLSLIPGNESAFLRVRAATETSSVSPQPLISVVLTAFNPDQDLVHAVASLLAQTWQTIEVLIVNDASDVSTHEWFEQSAALDPRVRVIHERTNRGTHASRNVGLSHANGEFVTFADADDWSHPQRLEVQAVALIKRPEHMANMTRSLRVTDTLQTVRVDATSTRVNISSLMFRRNPVLERLTGFDEVRKAGDTEFVERISSAFGPEAVCRLDECGALVQLTPDSLSRADFGIGWMHPDRRSYRRGFRAWHQQIAAGASAALTTTRRGPFPAPTQFLDRQAETPVAEAAIVVAAGLRAVTTCAPDLSAEAQALHSLGQRVDWLETPPIDDPIASAAPPPRSILEPWIRGETTLLHGGQSARCSLLTIRDPGILGTVDAGALANVETSTIAIVADYAPRTSLGWNYDPRNIERVLSAGSTNAHIVWLPATQAVAKTLTKAGATATVLAPRLYGVHPDLIPTSDSDPVSATPVAGLLLDHEHHSSRRRLDTMRTLAGGPLDARHAVHLSPLAYRRTFDDDSDTPRLITLRDHDLKQFLAKVSVVAISPSRTRGPHLSGTAISAMAYGVVPILPASFREIFGDAALYADTTNATQALERFMAAPDEFAAQQQRGQEFLKTHLSAERFQQTITMLLDQSARQNQR